jgi:hypothetical protein
LRKYVDDKDLLFACYDALLNKSNSVELATTSMSTPSPQHPDPPHSLDTPTLVPDDTQDPLRDVLLPNDNDNALPATSSPIPIPSPPTSSPLPSPITTDSWFPAEKLTACKVRQGHKWYRVKWLDGSPPSWQTAENVSPALRQAYHIQHTLLGKRRKRPLRA